MLLSLQKAYELVKLYMNLFILSRSVPYTGVFHDVAGSKEVVHYREKTGECGQSMKVKKNTRQRSEQIRQASAGLRDVLGMTQWRKEHLQATWAEIEALVDERINQLRAQLIQDMVQMGESEEWSRMPREERPKCVTCGKPLSARGEQTRFIQTTGGEAVQLTRTYGTCPACGVGFFPLDEELGLLSGGLTPRAEETLVRLSSWMPYESARELLSDLLGVQVSKATARRATLHSGQAALAVWDAEVELLEQEAPQAKAGVGEAEKQALSGDGAFVHLVGGEWVEVKTLAIGEVTRNRRGEVCTQHLSYSSRLCDAASFEHATLLQTHRRAVERAREVCAVQDGAEWLQGLVDYHRADAVRILDFAHAAEYRQPEVTCLAVGWMACCIGSSTGVPHGCLSTWFG
jgi:hypothetical protein